MLFKVLVACLLVACPLVAQVTDPLPNCKQERNKALGITAQDSVAKPMPGAFVPSCTDDGYYNSVQCSGSTGYCWCVEIMGGIKLPNTDVRFKTPNCPKTALSECERRRLAAKAGGQLGTQQLKCETDGSYKPIQIRGSVCYCVDDQGRKVGGSETPIAQCANLDCISKFTKCQKERHVGLQILRTKHMYGMFIPQCKGDGKYTETQCHERYCWCVNPETGEKKQDTTKVIEDGIKPLCSTNKHSECQKKYEAAIRLVKMGLLGVFVPKCKDSGDFEQIQCLGSIGMCWCVNEKNGKAIEATHKMMTDRSKPNCAITECQKQKKKADELRRRIPPIVGFFEPACEDNGKFTQKQCHGNSCYCVNIETGKQIGQAVERKDKSTLIC